MEMKAIENIKKARLLDIENQVLNAQHDVELLQSIVSSLTEKSQLYSQFVQTAEANRSKALANKNELADVVHNALLLKQDSKAADGQITEADEKMEVLIVESNTMVNELIYTVQIINKLATTIIREKAKNPLISDDLIEMITTASTNANDAVALCLIALKSTFEAKTSSIISKASISIENTEAAMMYEVLTKTSKNGKNSIHFLIDEAYTIAQDNFTKSQQASEMVNLQLNDARSKLNKAEVKLNALQESLAAAKAALLAS